MLITSKCKNHCNGKTDSVLPQLKGKNEKNLRIFVHINYQNVALFLNLFLKIFN